MTRKLSSRQVLRDRKGKRASQSEAASYPHSIINHKGVEIPVSRRTIKALDTMKVLFWNRAAKLHQIRPELAGLLCQVIQMSAFRPRPLRAISYESSRSRPAKSGNPNPLYLELGPDLEGAASVACDCRKCQRQLEDMDRTHLPWNVANKVHTQGSAA